VNVYLAFTLSSAKPLTQEYKYSKELINCKHYFIETFQKNFGSTCRRYLTPPLYFWRLNASKKIGEIGFILQMKVGLRVIFKNNLRHKASNRHLEGFV